MEICKLNDWQVIVGIEPNIPEDISDFEKLLNPPKPSISTHLKIGRNDPCICGSGKKYKKCCLNVTGKSELLKKVSSQRIRERNSSEQLIVDTNEMGIPKMSEVILDYADELLDMTSNFAETKKVIFIAICAWNISLIDEDKRLDKIESLLYEVMEIEKNSDQWSEIYDLVNALIEKRLTEYASCNRSIFDYEFIQLDKNNFHLNVMSTLIVDEDYNHKEFFEILETKKN